MYIEELLKRRKEIKKIISNFAYDGYPEIKISADNKKYIYIRKTVLGHKKSTYVGPYNENLFNSLLSDYQSRKKLNHELNDIMYQLAKSGYVDDGNNVEIIKNIGFVKSNIKNIIYNQVVNEGIRCSLSDIENILENKLIEDMTPENITKILNLKRAWQFILDNDIAHFPTNYYLLLKISKMVNENLIQNENALRTTIDQIKESSYVVSSPIESIVKTDIENILKSGKLQKEDIAIELFCYCYKVKPLIDGNERVALIFANHYLINKALGFLSINYKNNNLFKKLLVQYYENNNNNIKNFLKEKCISKMNDYLDKDSREIADIKRVSKDIKLNSLIDRLIYEKDNKIKNGIYHYTQIAFAYNSNHIEGSTLTEDDTRSIFNNDSLLVDKDRQIHVNDIKETSNHFECFKYLLDSLNEPLKEEWIKRVHKILKDGTREDREKIYKVGDYKTIPNIVGDCKTADPKDVPILMNKLISNYNNKENVSLNDIVNFHQEFESIHPFQDGNGRVGRLIMFRECLINDIIPFIVLDKYKEFYYRGLKLFKEQKGYLMDTLLSMQDAYAEYLKYFKIDCINPNFYKKDKDLKTK